MKSDGTNWHPPSSARISRWDGVEGRMTADERIKAEVARILSLPDDEQTVAIVNLIDALPGHQRDAIIAHMRDSKSGLPPRAMLISNRLRLSDESVNRGRDGRR